MAFIPDDAEERFVELTPSEERFYIYLCKKRNHKDQKSYGTIDECATKYGWERATKYNVQNGLIKKGWIEKNCTGWVLKVGDFSPVNKTSKSENSSKNLDEKSKKIDDLSKNLENPSKNLDNPPTTPIRNINIPAIKPAYTSSPRLDTQVFSVFDEWRTVLKHPNAKLDVKRKKKIKARLDEGFSCEDLKIAIRGVTLSPYHLGDNQQQTLYDGIETIFRDTAQVEKFIELAKKSQTTNCPICANHPDRNKLNVKEPGWIWTPKGVAYCPCNPKRRENG